MAKTKVVLDEGCEDKEAHTDEDGCKDGGNHKWKKAAKMIKAGQSKQDLIDFFLLSSTQDKYAHRG